MSVSRLIKFRLYDKLSLSDRSVIIPVACRLRMSSILMDRLSMLSSFKFPLALPEAVSTLYVERLSGIEKSLSR